ncbi:hypothetical protein HFD88_010640 [Aspergillus terreus]|nr:hypothetical protein HFD88_010640 [Aspergillus terreus]
MLDIIKPTLRRLLFATYQTITFNNVDSIKVENDPRVQYHTTQINGKTYGYLLAEPEGGYKNTVLLIHGFPNLSISWRRQIPTLLSMGFRVICPDCIGYGASDAPKDTLAPYTMKSHADDFKELIRSLSCEKVIVGGFDWGALLAYRLALWHPEVVSHLFTLCVPHVGIPTEWVDPETRVKKDPSLAYTLQFISGDVEKHSQTSDGVKHVLNALYGGQLPNGDFGTSLDGLKFDLIPHLERSILLDQDELEFYVHQFSKSGLAGPLNFYRCGQQNHEDDQVLLQQRGQDEKIHCPTMFIWPSKDLIITREMAESMAKFVPDLTFKEITGASHFAMWERPAEVNKILRDWLACK